ncbi:hypothetical protein SDC9_207837 [bioreactor metagenome]|uniref:Uncharacterized protein n=1 Tax=bioreactor metagenome TaxID=1076179 RepID=A0A645JAH6_9ZZZZ
MGFCLSDQVSYVGRIVSSTAFHFVVVPRQVLHWVLSRYAKQLFEAILAQCVCVSPLCGIIVAFVLIAFREPDRRRAVQPPMGGGCAEQRMLTHV